MNRLLATAGAGDVVPVNKAWFWAMKIPDAAYCWQYVVPEALALSAANGCPTPARYRFVFAKDCVTAPLLPARTVKSELLLFISCVLRQIR